MQLPLNGGCVCGALRYTVTEAPLMLYACHCTRCQRQSASAFQLSMLVRRTAFNLHSGMPRGWSYVTDSGAKSTSWFCPDCGVRTHGENTRRPTMFIVRGGSLDDTSWLVPAAHLWMRSAQKWQRFDDGTLCYETQPDDFDAVAAAWRARSGGG